MSAHTAITIYGVPQRWSPAAASGPPQPPQPLPPREGHMQWVDLYLILANPDLAGPGVRRLAEIIRAEVATECPKRQPLN